MNRIDRIHDLLASANLSVEEATREYLGPTEVCFDLECLPETDLATLEYCLDMKEAWKEVKHAERYGEY